MLDKLMKKTDAESFLLKIMTVKWLLTSLMIIAYFDMYLIFRLDTSIKTVLFEWSKNSIGWYYILESLILFSLILTIAFPAIRIFFLFVIGEFGLDLSDKEFNSNNKPLLDLKESKDKAIKENNLTLWLDCSEKEKEKKSVSQNISLLGVAAWGILAFSLLPFLLGKTSQQLPILIDIICTMHTYVDNNFIIYSFYVLIGFPFFILLVKSVLIRNET